MISNAIGSGLASYRGLLTAISFVED